MALTLDTRIPLLAVDQNFNPSKSFNTGVDSVLNERSKELSNRLEQLKMAYEEQKAKRAADAAAQLDVWRKGMQAGTPAVRGQPTPAVPAQYAFGQTEQTPNFSIGDLLTGKAAPQMALGVLKQQPTLVTPAQPSLPAQEITPAVPGREPTPEEYMRQLAQIQMGQGDVAGAIDTYKALGGYTKDMRPPNDGHPTTVGGIISVPNPAFPDTGEAAVVSYNPATNQPEVHPLGYRYTNKDTERARIQVSMEKNEDLSKRGWAGLSLRGQSVANQRARFESGGNTVRTFVSSNPDGTSSIRGVVFDRSGRQVKAFVVRDENGGAMAPKPGEVNARRNAGMVVAAEEATQKLQSLGELGGTATSFVQNAANLKDPSYIKQYVDSRALGLTDTRKQLIKQEFSGLARMAATVAGSGVINSQAAIDSFEKMMATPEGSSPEAINMAFLNVAAAIKAGLKHPIPGMTPGQVKQFEDLMGFYGKYPSPYDYAVFLKKQGIVPKDAGYKFDGVDLSAPVLREVEYDDATGDFVPSGEGSYSGGGYAAAPVQPPVAPAQPKQTLQEMYMEYKQERAKAYKAGNYDLVRRMDASALEDKLITAIPKAGGK